MRVSPEDMALYEQCKESLKTVHLKQKLVKILTPIAIILGIAALIVAYVLYRRKQRRNKKMRSMIQPKMNGQLLT